MITIKCPVCQIDLGSWLPFRLKPARTIRYGQPVFTCPGCHNELKCSQPRLLGWGLLGMWVSITVFITLGNRWVRVQPDGLTREIYLFLDFVIALSLWVFLYWLGWRFGILAFVPFIGKTDILKKTDRCQKR